MSTLYFLLATFLLSFSWYNAAFATEYDAQAWFNMTAMGAISKEQPELRYWLEMQERLRFDNLRTAQEFVRPGVGYALNDASSLWLGYARIYTAEPFASTAYEENRIWEQWLWNKERERYRITLRSRLEERYFLNDYHMGWRYRQLVKLAVFVPKHTRYSMIITDEVFFHLNNFIDDQHNRGYDQNRIFLGLGYKVNQNSTLEIGYLNQSIRRVNNENYSGNDLSVSVLING